MNWLIRPKKEDLELEAEWRANRGKDVPIVDENFIPNELRDAFPAANKKEAKKQK